MKRLYNKKALVVSILSLLLLFACRKHAYYQSNPNEPSAATPALLLTNISISVFNYDPTQPAYASRQLTYYERGNSAVDYSWTSSSYANFDILRQVMKMDELAQQTGEENYRGLAKFFRAVLFTQMTEIFGDIPYSDALKALEGNTKPKYDTQEDVYVGILQELEEANNILSDAKGIIIGDIIYGGKASQWKKLVNAFRLRVLMHLSKKEANTKLNIKSQFQNIVSDPAKYPLMTGPADNGQIVFNTSATSNYYPTAGSLSLGTAVSLEKGMADILKARNDPRIFSFGQPVAGQTPNVFANYAGVNAGLTVADQQSSAPAASRIHRRYSDLSAPAVEPLILVGYAEQEFLIAEAISRNWITGAGTAEEHYNNGITASMKFYGIGDAAIATYLAGPNVVFDTAKAIEMIIIQKYIALFMQSGWEAFFEQRRTGIPTLNVGPGTYNNMMVPKRWLYPQSEYDYNNENVEAAVQSQFAGDDNVNAVMWLLK
ncbi:SusD/RagB family nutrient-binding outer membrane lipoprotein [Terrimonas alba]|uniref:SusD/RagB family nutrient-binding outer membrane lipoprotein n=1 Tax=Terrimonas alba TaxID=3349636 RepID=UPI0035F310F0